MKERLLLAGGCSIVANRRVYPVRRYVQLIADHYNMHHRNLGLSGGTNDSISASLVHGIKRYCSDYDITVFVGWTSTMRFETRGKSNNTIGTSVLMEGERLGQKSRWWSDLGIIDRRLQRAMWSNAVGYYRFLHAREYLLTYCQLHNIKVVEVCSIPIKTSLLSRFEGWPINNNNADQEAVASLRDMFETRMETPELHALTKREATEDIVIRLRTEKGVKGDDPDLHPSEEESKIIADMYIPKFEFLNE